MLIMVSSITSSTTYSKRSEKRKHSNTDEEFRVNNTTEIRVMRTRLLKLFHKTK